jgi:hypothetical protein
MATVVTTPLEAIASRYLGLATRKADSLDFREQAVWQTHAALEAVHAAARNSRA